MGRDLARLRSSFGWAGGLFALRVTRRGRLDTGGLDDRMIRCLMQINGKWVKIDGINEKSTEIDASKWNIDEIQQTSMKTDLRSMITNGKQRISTENLKKNQ